MSNAKRFTKAGIAVLVLISSFNLTACGGRIKATNQVTPASTTPSADPNFYDSPTSAIDESAYTPAPVASAAPNASSGSFLVDQATLNQWQAKGIAVTGGMIYVSASDTSGLSKKGTVIKMNSSDGKGWKDLGSKYLGLSHPMAATIEGLAVNGSTIVAVDSASNIYTLGTDGSNIKTIKGAGGKDITSGAGSLYIANGSVEKTDVSATSRAAVTGLTSSGGVGSDNLGNVYVVSGVTIKKADTTGQVQDVVTTDLTGPIDVAVDSRDSNLYVLDTTMIKRFTATGQLIATFSSGATKPVGIAIDESGALYVADQGTTNKDSKVLKFSAGIASSATTSSASASSYNYGASGTNDYGTYSNTKKAVTTQTSTARRQ